MNRQTETRIGNNIRDIRESKKMTQEVLAAKLQLAGCDITRSSIAKIEVGQRHLYPDEIILIKEILETDFDKIFYGLNKLKNKLSAPVKRCCFSTYY